MLRVGTRCQATYRYLCTGMYACMSAGRGKTTWTMACSPGACVESLSRWPTSESKCGDDGTATAVCTDA